MCIWYSLYPMNCSVDMIYLRLSKWLQQICFWALDFYHSASFLMLAFGFESRKDSWEWDGDTKKKCLVILFSSSSVWRSSEFGRLSVHSLSKQIETAKTKTKRKEMHLRRSVALSSQSKFFNVAMHSMLSGQPTVVKWAPSTCCIIVQERTNLL